MTRETFDLHKTSTTPDAGLSWRLRGACSDMDADAFFPVGTTRASAIQYEHARQVCRGCEVSTQCLQFALDARADFGMWGGSTPLERQRMRWRREHAEEDRRALFGPKGVQAIEQCDPSLSTAHTGARDQVPDVRVSLPSPR